jgi:hypothetical protein
MISYNGKRVQQIYQQGGKISQNAIATTFAIKGLAWTYAYRNSQCCIRQVELATDCCRALEARPDDDETKHEKIS